MATIPVPGVNTPTYQSWSAAVANRLNRLNTAVAFKNFGDMGVIGAAAWRSLQMHSVAGMPAGVYMIQSDNLMAATANAYLGYRLAATAQAAGARVVLEAQTAQGQSVSWTGLLVMPAAGTLDIWVDYGFGGGNVHLKGGYMLASLLQEGTGGLLFRTVLDQLEEAQGYEPGQQPLFQFPPPGTDDPMAEP